MSDSDVGPIVWFVLIVGFAAYVTRDYVRYKRRPKKLPKLAMKLGLSFTPGYVDLKELGLADVPFFKEHKGYVENVMRGEVDDAVALLCDCTYSYRGVSYSRWGSGVTSKQGHLSIAAFHVHGAALPAFQLRPEKLMDKVSQIMGGADIDFEGYGKFSQRYLLKGSDEAAIRALFRPEILRFLEGARELFVESSGQWLLVYHGRLKADTMQTFWDTGKRLFRLIQERR